MPETYENRFGEAGRSHAYFGHTHPPGRMFLRSAREATGEGGGARCARMELTVGKSHLFSREISHFAPRTWAA